LTRKRLKRQLLAAAALFVAAAASLLLFGQPGAFLVLRNSKSGQLYGKFPLEEGGRFSVTFIHSVNKSPVTDIYEVRNGTDLYVVETDYYDFDAGVQTELNPGETLTYGGDGAMQIKNIDKRIPDLIYVVGTVSDHTLSIGGKEISLRDLCGRNSSVRFTVQQDPF
jgi:hypothetical protein